MKSLPEKKFWSEIKHRLESYTEEPDDNTWDKITGVIHPGNSINYRYYYAAQVMSVLGLASLFLLLYPASVYHTREVVHLDVEQPITHQENYGASEFITETNKEVKEDKFRKNKISTATKAYSKVSTDETKQTESVLAFKGQDEGTIALPESIYQNDKRNLPTINSSSGSDGMVDSATVETDHKLPIGERQQEEFNHKKKKNNRSYPSVYFIGTPSLAYQKIVPIRNDEVVIQQLHSKEIFSGDRFGVSVQSGVQIPLTNKIEISAGILYYRQNQTLGYSYLSPDKIEIEKNESSLSYTVKPSASEKEFSYAMQNVGVAVGFWYLLKNENLMHKFGAGLQYQHGLLEKREGSSYNNASSSYLNYELAYRLEFPFNQNFHLIFQPAFIHSLKVKENLQEPFVIKPYRAGLSFGLLYNF